MLLSIAVTSAVVAAGTVGLLSGADTSNGLCADGVVVNGRIVRDVEWRTEPDGVAVRYRLPEGRRLVSHEETSWTLPTNALCWYQERPGKYEEPYVSGAVASIPVGTRLNLPITFKLVDGTYRLITEANLVDYTDLAVEYVGQGRFRALYYAEKGPFEQTGADTTPWRVTIVATNLDQLVNSDLVRRLCPPPTHPKSVSLHRPGRCIWQWLPAGDPVYAEQKDWYDRTRALGFEYYLIDDGWKRWRADGKDQWACLKAAIDYGKSVGVRSVVWADSKEMPDAASRRAYLDKVVQTGAVGIKIDFIPPCDHVWCKWYEETLADTAERGLFVDFHGAVKPTGRERTWPHELAREAVRGHEYHVSRYGRVQTPEHDTILPFCRAIQGHADYTPVVFERSQLIRFTWPRQLAQGVIMACPFLCFGDYPSNYLSSPMAEIVKHLPPTYDETVVLPGSEIGACVAFARRAGGRWFVAVENAANMRKLDIPLSFLGSGEWRLRGFRDDPGGRLDACAGEERTVTSGDSLELEIKPCGGYVAEIERVAEAPAESHELDGIRFAYRPTVVFRASEKWEHAREPLLARKSDGTLSCLLYTGGKGEPSPENVVAEVVSADDGETWSDPKLLFSHPARACWATEYFSEAGGDPVVFFQTYASDRFFEELRSFVTVQRDGKWSDPVSPLGVPPNFTVRQGHVLSDGSWLFPLYWQVSTGGWQDRISYADGLPQWNEWHGERHPSVSAAMRSEDRGRTWRMSNAVSALEENGGEVWEPCLVELEDGHVRMFARGNRPFLWEADSFDGGRTFSKPHRGEIPNADTKPAVLKLGNRIVLINNVCPSNCVKRNSLELWISEDNCKTWSRKIRLARIENSPYRQVAYPAAYYDRAADVLYVVVDAIKRHYLLKIPGRDLLADGNPAARDLFNGRDLSGWYKFLKGRGRDNDPKNVISVTNGVIRITGEEFGCLTTEDEFSDYHLRVEYRFPGGRHFGWKEKCAPDSGILFHSTGPDGAFQGTWMEALELNLIKGATGDFWGVGCENSDRVSLSAKVGRETLDGYRIYDPEGTDVFTITGNTRVCRMDIARDWTDEKKVKESVDENPLGEWNVAELYCQDGNVLVKFNGKIVNRGFNAKPTKGRIQLQSEGCPVEFRRITLEPLTRLLTQVP